MGKAHPVGYIKPSMWDGPIYPNYDPDSPWTNLNDDIWVATKRASVWYECENCGWMTHPAPVGEYLQHQCPDGTVPDRFVTARPFDEFAAEEALKGLVKILNDQAVA